MYTFPKPIETTLDRTKITLRGAGVQQPQDRHFDIAVAAIVEVTATAAKRAATGWLISEVGNMLVGGSPKLMVGGHTFWRMPVLLTSSTSGVIGQVEAVDIVAESAVVISSTATIDTIHANAAEITRPLSPSA